jgi:outer membrane receptor protein involved in Fe transport
MRYNFFQNYNPEGIWRFSSLTTFLTNQPTSLEGGLPDRLNPRALRQTLYGGYIQDDWRVLPHLTLNIGLRYEMTTLIGEAQGKITNLANLTDPLPYCQTSDPSLTLVFGKPGCTGVRPYYSNPTKLDFEPRFGFAWDPRGDGKTAIRGGFAIFDVLPASKAYRRRFSRWASFLALHRPTESAFWPANQTVHSARWDQVR